MSGSSPAVLPQVGSHTIALGHIVADDVQTIGVFKSAPAAIHFAQERSDGPLAVVREGQNFSVRTVNSDAQLTSDVLRKAINAKEYHPPEGTVALVVPNAAGGRAKVVAFRSCDDKTPPLSDANSYVAMGAPKVGSSAAYVCEPGFHLTDGLPPPTAGVKMR